MAGFFKPFREAAVTCDAPGPAGRCSWAGDAAHLDTYPHAMPAMQEEAAALIAGLVVARKQRALAGCD